MKRQEDKESCFSATEENIPFIWKAINGYVSMAAFMSTSFQLSAGPKEPSCPSLATSSLLVLTVAQAFHGSRDGDTIPKMYQEKCYDIWEAKAFQPLTVLPFASVYLMAYIWPSRSGPRLVAEGMHLKKTLAQGFLIFSRPLPPLILSLKWVQIDKMESSLLGIDFGNQRTLAKPGPHLLFPMFIGMRSSKMEICFPCSFMTLLLPDYPTLWQFASLWACGKWNKLP